VGGGMGAAAAERQVDGLSHLECGTLRSAFFAIQRLASE